MKKLISPDVVIILLSLISAVFSIVEIVIFFLTWLLILLNSHLTLIPFITWKYIKLQIHDLTIFYMALLCFLYSFFRLLMNKNLKTKITDPANDTNEIVEKHFDIRIVYITFFSLALCVFHMVLLRYWPFVYYRH